MTIRPILTAENPVLREKSKKVAQFGDGLQKLVRDLFETLHAAHGLGLAAPQIGVLQRVIVIELPAEYDEEGHEVLPAESYALVNPEVVKMNDLEEMEEGCLSVPGYRGLVKRATLVTVKALDPHGRPLRLRADDLLAQVLQHEIDHLHGVLYLDRLETPDKIWRLQPQEDAEPAPGHG
jgi:peptide deformylase